MVKAVFYNSMELDVAAKPKTAPGEWGSLPPAVHKCVRCSCAFQTHMKAKHKTRAPAAAKIGLSTVCPCCHVQFSSRARLLAHASEKRNRGNRAYSCSMLFATDLVKAVPNDELDLAFEKDKQARTTARRAGHTVPISDALAKRPKVGVSVLEQQLTRKRKLAAGMDVTVLPANAVQLENLKPLKRCCTKSSQELVVVQHVAKQMAS